MVIFSRNKRSGDLAIPNIGGKPVKLVDQVKHLGVVLDNKLSWAPHLSNKIKKAISAFWQCRRTFGQIWGLSPKILYFFYTTIIGPMFSYAAIVWWPRVKLKSSIAKLNHLQRIACLAITGAMSFTPTLAMETILSIPPLDTYILGSASSTAYRLYCNGAWNLCGKVVGHSIIWGEIKSQIPNIAMTSDHLSTQYCFIMPYLFWYPTREWWCSAESIKALENCVMVFADESVSKLGPGLGVFSTSLNLEISEALGNFRTVFQAEIAAIHQSDLEARNANLNNQHIIFCVDSLLVLHLVLWTIRRLTRS